MGRKQKLVYILGGFVLGVLLTNVVCLCRNSQMDTSTFAVPNKTQSEPLLAASGVSQNEAVSLDEAIEQDNGSIAVSEVPEELLVGSWDSGAYWTETRGMPSYKVVLGVPFYARPSWAVYGTILEIVPDAYDKDHVAYNGMEVYYNGVETIVEKTKYAREKLGGIMILELTQDASDMDKSLLQAIGRVLRQ